MKFWVLVLHVVDLTRSGCFIWAASAAFLAGSAALLLKVLDTEILERPFLVNNNPDPVVFNVFIVFCSLVATFRTSHAVMRFTEAAATMHKLSACSYNTASTLVAFCRVSPKNTEVMHFKETLVRLISLMNALILNELEHGKDCVELNGNHVFEVLGWDDLSDEIQFGVMNSAYKVEFAFQCIQQLMVDGMENHVLSVPPPILTRSFQELGAGLLNYHEAKKFSHVPLPFAYRLVTFTILLAEALFMPFILAQYTQGRISSFGCTACGTFLLWFLNGVAESLDNPFKKASITLNTGEVQAELNGQLKELWRQSHSPTPALNPAWHSAHDLGNRASCGVITMEEARKSYVAPKGEGKLWGHVVSVASNFTVQESVRYTRGSQSSMQSVPESIAESYKRHSQTSGQSHRQSLDSGQASQIDPEGRSRGSGTWNSEESSREQLDRRGESEEDSKTEAASRPPGRLVVKRPQQAGQGQAVAGQGRLSQESRPDRPDRHPMFMDPSASMETHCAVSMETHNATV